MVRGTFLTGVLVLMLTVPTAWAEKVELDAGEIEALLAGNTISGTWGGSEYKQHFSVDGGTLYVPAEGEGDEGKWRVNASEGTYESWWAATGWTGYKVAREGDTYFWIDDAGGEHPFTVMQGKQL